MKADGLTVALINMPWARTSSPSIQCGLLKSELVAAGYTVDVHYLNLELAAEIGIKIYEAISHFGSDRVHLLGEWLFGRSAFDTDLESKAYLEAFPELENLVSGSGMELESLLTLREETLPRWIESLASADWGKYDLIGFTSTFEQNVAALALARAVKGRFPQVSLVFGGANFDGDMGVEFFNNFDFIDFAVTGEGDIAIVKIAESIATGSHDAIPGVCRRDGGEISVGAPAARIRDMDSIPTPNYDDYFSVIERRGHSTVIGRRNIRIPVEFSRGCWWGEKHHCTFCGLNASGMTYRSKSPELAVADLLTLAGKHRILELEAVDNIIDMQYLEKLCPVLADHNVDLDLFFEVKSNLQRRQIGRLASAGVRRIQPGIESLSTHVLGLMRKGTTMPFNVRFMKWATYYGINIIWNILMGFPGETDEDYERQVELIPSLYHLQPPGSAGRLWLERYSPYFTDPSFPITMVRPKEAYSFAYPVPGLNLHQIAYFFDHEVGNIASQRAHDAVVAAVERWHTIWRTRRPQLTYQRGPGFIHLWDTRGPKPEDATIYGWKAIAFELCSEVPHTPGRISEELQVLGHDISTERVTKFLESCADVRYVVMEDGKCLSLALPRVSSPV
ncbi:hypothetical protein BIV23_41620 [Streptomyces monashensis]|uniref:Radical SAM core domain-containing protein n=2 Tax=Streptomyces monashensis TaxID=1678012 RepID=A0A1S2P6X1_9ACTN|nr:hypothetical protein BIV23_41620 [Streptomyces monashensis]